MTALSLIIPLLIFVILSGLLMFLQGDLHRLLFAFLCFLSASLFSIRGDLASAIIVILWAVSLITLPKVGKTNIKSFETTIAIIIGTSLLILICSGIIQKSYLNFISASIFCAGIISFYLSKDTTRKAVSLTLSGMACGIIANFALYSIIILIFTTLLAVGFVILRRGENA